MADLLEIIFGILEIFADAREAKKISESKYNELNRNYSSDYEDWRRRHPYGY